MRFGTFYFFQAPPGHRHADIIHRELEQVAWTEELGLDEVWLTEHHFIDYGLSVDPATLAAAAASRTRRVRIGLAAAILPFHHPVRLAEQTIIVDIISRGRLDVGVGRGNRPAEFAGYRVPQEESRERFDEAVEVLRRAWTEERFSYAGRFFLRGPVDQLVANRDVYVAALQKAGRSGAEVATLLTQWGVSRQIYVADTDARALEEAKDREARAGDLGRARPGDARLRLARHGCAAHRDDAPDGRRPRPLLDELRRTVPGEDPPLDGIVRARSHAAVQVRCWPDAIA